MSLTDKKITTGAGGDIQTHGLHSAPDKLTGTAQQNKDRFDELIREAVAVKYNALIDALTDETAADEIGAVDPDGNESTVQDELDGRYILPSEGIPASDMTAAVQTSLGKADSALQEHQDISGKENSSNKVTSLSAESTDAQYPSAKCVYDLVGTVEAALEALL